MTGGIRRQDIEDTEIVDAVELASDGTSVLSTGVSVVSTTSSTKRIVCSGVDFIHDADQRLEPQDIAVLTGTSGGLADGIYHVTAIIDSETFEVADPIADSTGGSAEFRYPSGALKVGFDPTGLTQTAETTVQEVIRDHDAAILLRLTPDQHATVRQLIHFLESNSPGDGFGVGPLYSETSYTSNVFPVNETWYETAAMLKKICRWEGTYNLNKTFATEKWIVYKPDGTSPAADATDAISYTGVREDSRTRTIVVY